MRPISFTLIVDEFRVKYIGKKHANHIIKLMKKHYTVERPVLSYRHEAR